MALISGSLPPQTCYGTPQQLLDLFAQYLSPPTQNVVLEGTLTNIFPVTPGGIVGSRSTATLSVAGASVGDPVLVGLPSIPTSGVVFDAYVGSPNSVTVRCNYLTATANPGSQTLKIKVFKVS
jgi:hypothetical protein